MIAGFHTKDIAAVKDIYCTGMSTVDGNAIFCPHQARDRMGREVQDCLENVTDCCTVFFGCYGVKNMFQGCTTFQKCLRLAYHKKRNLHSKSHEVVIKSF